MKYQEWVTQVDELLMSLSTYGKKAIFYGHSTGALLSMYAASQAKSSTQGLFLLSPALNVSRVVTNLSSFFKRFNISGNAREALSAIPFVSDPKKYDSTFAEKEVRLLGKFVINQVFNYSFDQKKFTQAKEKSYLSNLPMQVFDTELDLVIRTSVNKAFFKQLENTNYQVIDKKFGVFHNQIMFINPKKNKATEVILNKLNEFVDGL